MMGDLVNIRGTLPSVTATASARCAVYVRVSTEEQRERQSIATQRDFAERHCALHGIPIYGWYADDGVSGTIALEQRPEGARLLADARAGKFAIVLIYRLDRLGRDPRLTLNAVNDLEQLGVQVKSMTEPIDPSTSAGRFMLTMLAAQAGFERDSIVERSVAGTNRLAREGAWLGGIVPYGYRVVGKGRDARLVIAEQPLAGLDLSEADVVRLIYRLCTDEDQATDTIATHLNALGVPPAYVRDGRTPQLRGKRAATVSGIWRGGRIRNVLVNSTYKGLHRYGKRSKKQGRDIIEREVPAIVSVEQWERAQQALTRRMLFSRRNATRDYLLRGQITCGVCGLRYGGTAWPDTASPTGTKLYYVCNGHHRAKAIYGANAPKCTSKAIHGDKLEAAVWRDIEGFGRDPGAVLEQLAAQRRGQASEAERLRDEIARMQQRAQAMQGEKDSVIALYRRGRIDSAALDRQLDQIQQEEKDLHATIACLQDQAQSAQQVEEGLRSAGALLQQLRARLDAPLTFEVKRQLVETLIERIVVDTITDQATGKQHAQATVTYRFGPLTRQLGGGSHAMPSPAANDDHFHIGGDVASGTVNYVGIAARTDRDSSRPRA